MNLMVADWLDRREFLAIGGLFCLIFAVPPVGVLVAFSVLFFQLLRRPEWLVKFVVYATFLRVLSAFVVKSGGSLIGPISMGCTILAGGWCLGLMVMNRRGISDRSFFYFFIFVGVSAVASFFGAEYVSFSWIKLGAYFFNILILYTGYHFSRGYDWQKFWLTLASATFVLCLPLMIWGGYHANNRFEGIFNQSQAFGVMVAPLYLWLIIFFVRHWNRLSLGWRVIGILATFGMVVQMNLSGCRTAGVAMLLVPVVTLFLRGSISWRVLFHKKVMAAFAGIVSVLVVFKDTFKQFFVKDFNPDRLMSTNIEFLVNTQYKLGGYYDNQFFKLYSRMAFVLLSYFNIRDHFWTGIGWAVPTLRLSDPVYFSYFNIVVNLPGSSEKGVAWVALLEEVGIFGFMAFVWYFGYIVKRLYRHSDSIYLQLLILIVLLNFGEATFFSANGMGAYQMAIVLVGLFVAPKNALA